MTTLEELKTEIEKIKFRNQKVEQNKRWENSKTRKVLLSLFTYLAIGFYLQAIGIIDPWFNAVVPAISFLLSTLTMPFFKKLWVEYLDKG